MNFQIEGSYQLEKTAFENGAQLNAAGEKSGSCKLLSFAQLNNLDKAQTLASFDAYYRDDVLKNQRGDDHQNIR